MQQARVQEQARFQEALGVRVHESREFLLRRLRVHLQEERPVSQALQIQETLCQFLIRNKS